MRVEIDGVTLELMGDPHVGKRFVNGVPLHRRGEREATVLDDFGHSLLLGGEADLHVCMGDLFHAAVVPYGVILDAATTYLTVADHYPRTTFVVLRGNHDQGRDLEARTAFDVFTGLVARQENVEVLHDPRYDAYGLAFFPWCGTGTLEDAVRSFPWKGVKAAFFHADVDPRNGEDNLIPTKALAELGITRAFTGHDHKPRRFERDGVDVTVVGSLQPYSFGEEVDDKLYVTIPRSEIWQHDAAELKDKVVRIDLIPGEERDVELDCLQLVYRQVGEAETEETKVEIGDFDLERLAGEVFAELGLDEATAAKVKGLISSQRMKR